MGYKMSEPERNAIEGVLFGAAPGNYLADPPMPDDTFSEASEKAYKEACPREWWAFHNLLTLWFCQQRARWAGGSHG